MRCSDETAPLRRRKRGPAGGCTRRRCVCLRACVDWRECGGARRGGGGGGGEAPFQRDFLGCGAFGEGSDFRGMRGFWTAVPELGTVQARERRFHLFCFWRFCGAVQGPFFAAISDGRARRLLSRARDPEITDPEIRLDRLRALLQFCGSSATNRKYISPAQKPPSHWPEARL